MFAYMYVLKKNYMYIYNYIVPLKGKMKQTGSVTEMRTQTV